MSSSNSRSGSTSAVRAAASNSKSVSSSKRCLCRDSDRCLRLTAAFAAMERNDPRKEFVRLPPLRKTEAGVVSDDADDGTTGRTTVHSQNVMIRRALLHSLLSLPGNHAVDLDLDQEATDVTCCSEYIAAHHFHPNIVLHFRNGVPRTITKQQAQELGLFKDANDDCDEVSGVNDCFMIMDQVLQERVYIVLPNYPMQKSLQDASCSVMNASSDHAKQETKQQRQHVLSNNTSRPTCGSGPAQSQSQSNQGAAAATRQPRGILRGSDSKASTSAIVEPNHNKARRPRPPSRSNSRVKFGTVAIREHPIIPGDNPGGIRGPPLTIDWEHHSELSATLDDYEKDKPKIRTASEFQMPSTVRHKLLRQAGYSTTEIQKYTKRANIIRNSRKQSREMAHMYGLSKATEKVTRGLSNLTIRRGRKLKERNFLESALKSAGAGGSTTSSSTTSTTPTTVNNGLKKETSVPLTEEEVISSDEEERRSLEC